MKVIKYFDKEDESFNNICRHGLSRDTNKESLLAVCVQNLVDKKLHYWAFPLIKEEKWFIGAKTKYDIPQYIEGIPDGFAIFCTTWEAGKIRKYQEQLDKKNRYKNNENKEREVEDMDVMNKRFIEKAMKKNNSLDGSKNRNEDSDNEELDEPVPRGSNKYCHICNMKFKKYLEHIKSIEHFDGLRRHKNTFNRFKNTFQNIIRFWDNKKKEIVTNKINSEKDLKNNNTIKIKKEENSFDEKMSIENNNFSVDMINNNSENNIDNDKNNNPLGYEISKNININISNNNDNKDSSNKSNIKIEEIKENICNNIKIEENPENNISSNINNHSFYLTCSTDNKTNVNSILNINNIFSMNSSNNHYINKTDNNTKAKENILNKIKENFNSPKKNINQSIKEENDLFKPHKKFITCSVPLFSSITNHQFLKPRKRKRNEPEKTLEMFVVTTPKRIKYDRFPLLSRDNPKKLINNSILFFK